MNKITYHKEGDYLISDLIMYNPCEDYHIGKYGRLRLNYIKNYKRGLYTELTHPPLLLIAYCCINYYINILFYAPILY